MYYTHTHTHTHTYIYIYIYIYILYHIYICHIYNLQLLITNRKLQINLIGESQRITRASKIFGIYEM